MQHDRLMRNFGLKVDDFPKGRFDEWARDLINGNSMVVAAADRWGITRQAT